MRDYAILDRERTILSTVEPVTPLLNRAGYETLEVYPVGVEKGSTYLRSTITRLAGSIRRCRWPRRMR